MSELYGKCVLLLFATYSSFKDVEFLSKLQGLYQSKTADQDFEIVYMSLDCDESSLFPKAVQAMPWVAHAFAPKFAHAVARKIFGQYPRFPAIAAFGPTGNLQAKESDLAFKTDGDRNFPFIKNMDEEIEYELRYDPDYKWDLESIVNPNNGFLRW